LEAVDMLARPVLVIAIALLMSGCGGSSKSRKDQMREETKRYNQMADIMSTITDRASLQAAKSKLKPLFVARFERQRKLREQEKQMSPAEKEKAAKEEEDLKADPDYEKSKEAVKRYAGEYVRISSTPGLGDLLSAMVEESIAEVKGNSGH